MKQAGPASQCCKEQLPSCMRGGQLTADLICVALYLCNPASGPLIALTVLLSLSL